MRSFLSGFMSVKNSKFDRKFSTAIPGKKYREIFAKPVSW